MSPDFGPPYKLRELPARGRLEGGSEEGKGGGCLGRGVRWTRHLRGCLPRKVPPPVLGKKNPFLGEVERVVIKENTSTLQNHAAKDTGPHEEKRIAEFQDRRKMQLGSPRLKKTGFQTVKGLAKTTRAFC